jgi:hypothetical protein
MKRIVTSTYRYKRPPRKRKAQQAAIPQAVVVKISKPKQRHVQRLEEARAALPVTAPPANDDRPAETLSDRPTKSAIVTIRHRGRRFADVPDMTPEEHRRVGDLADALFREIVRRATRERDR